MKSLISLWLGQKLNHNRPNVTPMVIPSILAASRPSKMVSLWTNSVVRLKVEKALRVVAVAKSVFLDNRLTSGSSGDLPDAFAMLFCLAARYFLLVTHASRSQERGESGIEEARVFSKSADIAVAMYAAAIEHAMTHIPATMFCVRVKEYGPFFHSQISSVKAGMAPIGTVAAFRASDGAPEKAMATASTSPNIPAQAIAIIIVIGISLVMCFIVSRRRTEQQYRHTGSSHYLEDTRWAAGDGHIGCSCASCSSEVVGYHMCHRISI